MIKGAVIIDTRLQDFTDVVERHFRFLPSDWKLMIFTDDLAKTLTVPVLDPMNPKIFKARIQPINNLNEYNRILTSLKFWQSIPFDKILIFQNDSELLREGIEDFLHLDYVGAPWNFQEHGGNGGLSLRSKDAMIRTIIKHPYDGHNEDTYFSNNLVGKLADRETCRKFSVETVFGLGSIGCHAIDSHFPPYVCSQIRNFSNRNN